MANRFKRWRKLHFKDGSVVYYIIKRTYDWYDVSARVLIYVNGMYKNISSQDILNKSGIQSVTPKSIKDYIVKQGWKEV